MRPKTVFLWGLLWTVYFMTDRFGLGLGSLLPAVLFGVALADIFQGIPSFSLPLRPPP